VLHSYKISEFYIFRPENRWRHNLSKCASVASQFVSYEFYNSDDYIVSFDGLSVLALKYELNCQEKSKFEFISKRRIISLRHSSILPRIWLNFMALCLVFTRRLFQFSHFFRISNFFDLSITEET
jgi:hypothetical protein